MKLWGRSAGRVGRMRDAAVGDLEMPMKLSQQKRNLVQQERGLTLEVSHTLVRAVVFTTS